MSTSIPATAEMMPRQRCELIEAALEYARMGRPVFPLRARSKVPATPHGYKDATADEAAVRRWWERWPDANIATPTGHGRLVVDVDDSDSLHRLEQEHHELPETVRAETGGGGEHYWFRCSTPIASSAGKLGPGLDIRGEGGYVVLPPSIHESGRLYAWDVPPGEVPVAHAPEWLVALLQPVEQGPRRQPASVWQELAGGVGEGQRNVAVAKVYGYLLARGVDAVLALELVAAWDARCNRPALGRDEVHKICESIARREMAKRRRRS